MDINRAFEDILNFTEENLDQNISRIEVSNMNQRQELNNIKIQIKDIILTLAEKFSIGLDSQPTVFEETLSSKVKTYISSYSKRSIQQEKPKNSVSTSPVKNKPKEEDQVISKKGKENPEVVPERATVKKPEETIQPRPISSPAEILKEKKSSDHVISKLKKGKAEAPKSPFLSSGSSYFPKRFITDKVSAKNPQTINTNTISSIKDTSLVINESHLEVDESLINSLKPEEIAIKPEVRLSPEKKEIQSATVNNNNQNNNNIVKTSLNNNVNESFSNKQSDKKGHSRNNSKTKASYYISSPATEKKINKLISSKKGQETETSKKSGLSVKEHQKKGVIAEIGILKKTTETSSTRKSSANDPSMEIHKIEKNLSAKFEDKAMSNSYQYKSASNTPHENVTVKKNAKAASNEQLSLIKPQNSRHPRSMTENENLIEKQKHNYSMSEEKKSITTERNSSPPSKIKSYYYFFGEKK